MVGSASPCSSNSSSIARPAPLLILGAPPLDLSDTPIDLMGMLRRELARGTKIARASPTRVPRRKALGSEWEGEVALDVVRALTRTWPRSGVGPAARALCLEAAARAIAMAGAPELPASQRLLGRALAACAHVRLLSGLPPGDEARGR